MTHVTSKADAAPESYVPWRELLTRAFAPSLALVCLAVWLHAADSLIVATMLPAMVAEVGGAALIGWSVSLYEIGSIVAGAASALLTAQYGVRAPMSLAAALFGLGCVTSALSPNMELILVGRTMQGLGGGCLVAMSFVAAGMLFPRRYMARVMAAISTFWGASAFLGPLIGGLFVEYATWRWGFVFFGLQAFVLAAWIALRCEAGRAESSARGSIFPWRRLGLLSIGVILIASAGVEISWSRTAGCTLAGLGCLIVFLRSDARAGETRMLPLRPLDLRERTGGTLLMILCLCIATIAITAYGPLLVTMIHGASALTAGYIVACSSIGWTIMAVLVSGSPERLDRAMIMAGVGLIVLSVIGFLVFLPAGPIWLIAVCAGVEGGGFGLAWTFILRRVTADATPGEARRISGAIPTIQRLGYALGAAYVGIVANASGLLSMSSAEEAALVARWIFLACLPFAALGLIAMTCVCSGRGADDPS